MIRKVAITGPESTGKTALAEQLAAHYRTLWVPEFARSYIQGLGRPYEELDIQTIARGQLNLEIEMENAIRNEMLIHGQGGGWQFLFCDSELLVTKIWSEVKYGRCASWILRQLERHNYDLYLLCYIDTPWEEDPQREHPFMREQLFSLYYDEMLERQWDFRVVTGLNEERLTNAINLIEECFT